MQEIHHQKQEVEDRVKKQLQQQQKAEPAGEEQPEDNCPLDAV
jgi:hypothetical protein